MQVVSINSKMLTKPIFNLFFAQGLDLLNSSGLTKRNQTPVPLARKYKNETVFRLRAEACLAVGQIVIPNSHEDVIESHPTHNLFATVETPSPLCEGFSIVQADVINVF